MCLRPRQSARTVIPATIAQALTQPVVRLGDQRPTWDLNFVMDTARGFILAPESDQAIGKTINWMVEDLDLYDRTRYQV